MEAKRSQLRFKITVSLALAGLTAAGGVLLYRAGRAGAGTGAGSGAARRRAEPVRRAGAAVPGRADSPTTAPLLPPNGVNEEHLAELMPRGRASRKSSRRRQPTTTTAPATAPAIPPGADRAARASRPARAARASAAGPAATVAPANVNRTPATPPAPRPTTHPAAAVAHAGGSAPPATQPGAVFVPPNGNPGGIMLNFQDASIDAVLDELSAVAGFIVVKEVPRSSGTVTLVSKQPVTPDEAVSLLNTVLLKSNLRRHPPGPRAEGDGDQQGDEGRDPRAHGQRPEKIEPTDELITQVIPIRNADAAAAQGGPRAADQRRAHRLLRPTPAATR